MNNSITPEQQAQLDALTYEDIYRAMRSYGFDGKDHVQQEGMRRALVSFILKRDVPYLPPYTVADGHRIPPLPKPELPAPTRLETRVLAHENTYTITHKGYGKAQPNVVRTAHTPEGMKTRAARIAEGVGGRRVHKDRGYRMSDQQLERFKALVALPTADWSPITRTWRYGSPEAAQLVQSILRKHAKALKALADDGVLEEGKTYRVKVRSTVNNGVYTGDAKFEKSTGYLRGFFRFEDGRVIGLDNEDFAITVLQVIVAGA